MRIFVIFSLLFCLFGVQLSVAWPQDCVINPNSPDFKWVLEKCQWDGSVSVGNTSGWVTAVKDYVKKVATQVIAYGALFAIGALVASGIMYTVAYGDDGRMTTAKNIGIYALIGLVLLVVAFPLVGIIVDFIYGLWT